MNLRNGLAILVLGLLSFTTLALDLDTAATDTTEQKTEASSDAPPPALPPDATTAAPATTSETPAADLPAASDASAEPATDLSAGTDDSAEAKPDAAAAPIGEASASSEFKTLDQDVQTLKKDVLDLNRELFVLEEELLYPADTQVAIFVSMDVGAFFGLDTITLKVDNKQVANYLYTTRETQALLKGGVQRVYVGNLKVGEHELVAFFTGKGPSQRDYKRGATLKFTKGVGAKYLELKISDKVIKEQPEFIIKEWE
jgi:hypothetical protein